MDLATYYKNSKLVKSSDELMVEDIYNRLLTLFTKYIPNDGGTYANDLNKFGYGLLNQFRGVFTRDQVSSMRFSKGDSLVVNVDTSKQGGSHWIGLYCFDKKTFLFYDSFGRDHKTLMKNSLKSIGKVIDTDMTDREQKINEVTCGERSLVFLFICENLGIEYAKLL